MNNDHISHTVVIQVDGKEVMGSYTESGKTITVHYAGHQRSAQLGGLDADELSRSILGELYRHEQQAGH